MLAFNSFCLIFQPPEKKKKHIPLSPQEKVIICLEQQQQFQEIECPLVALMPLLIFWKVVIRFVLASSLKTLKIIPLWNDGIHFA